MKYYTVQGKTVRSYWDVRWNKKGACEPFSVVVKAKNQDAASEHVREMIQLSRNLMAIISHVEEVEIQEECSGRCALDMDMPWWKTRLVAFDTETTGVSYEKDRIVEIGFSEYNPDTKSFEEPKSWLLNEGKPIPQELLDKEINDITNEMLQDKPTFDDAFEEFSEYFGEDVIFVAHNRGFDSGMVLSTIKRSDHEIYFPPTVCSMELAINTELGQLNNRLEHLCQITGISDEDQSHRAGDDAQNAGNLFLHLARKKPYFHTANVRQFLQYFDASY